MNGVGKQRPPQIDASLSDEEERSPLSLSPTSPSARARVPISPSGRIILSEPTTGLTTNSAHSPVNWTIVYISLFTIQMVNALYTVTVKAALKVDVNPVIFSFYRDILAFPILQVAAVLVDGRIVPDVGILVRLAILGLTGVMGNQILYILGLSFITSTEATVVSQSQPMFAAVLAALCGLEKFGWHTGLGLLLVFLGVMILVGPQELFQDMGERAVSDELQGVGLVMLSAVCMALYYVMQKPVLKVYPPLSVTSWTYMVGAVWMGTAALPYVSQPDQWSLNREGYVALALAVVGNSCLKYSLQSYCNKNLSVVVLTIWSSMVPILTAILAYFMIGEGVTLSDLGALPIFIGLGIVTWSRRNNKAAVNPKDPLVPSVKSFASLGVLSRTSLADALGELDENGDDMRGSLYEAYYGDSSNLDPEVGQRHQAPAESAGLTSPLLGSKP